MLGYVYSLEGCGMSNYFFTAASLGDVVVYYMPCYIPCYILLFILHYILQLHNPKQPRLSEQRQESANR